MKKIFNWTFGSVFRTFGRIIAYIIIGFIVSLILSNSDFRITDLFFDNVKASEVRVSNYNYYKNSALTTPWEMISTAPTYYGQNFGTVYGARQFIQFFPNTITLNNENKVKFRVYNTYSGLTYENYTASIIGYVVTNNGSYWCTTQQVDTQANFVETECDIPTTTTSITEVSFFTIIRMGNPTQITFGLSPTVAFYKDTNVEIKQVEQQQLIEMQTQTNAINSQTQQQHEDANKTQETIINSTNQTISTITDNSSPDLNGTLDNNTIAGWLPPGPIDSIVTLPLTLLNSLFNAMGGTCADLVVPLPFVNKNLNIPCMSRIYNDMSFSSFFNWIGVVASAFILYKYLLRLYKWIDATLTLRENTQVDWGGD